MSAGTLKHWREAATLMLVHCRTRFTPKRSPVENICESSDAVRKQTINSSTEDLEILVLKRSSQSSFMPDFYVFPGGAAANADFSEKWLDVFGIASQKARDNLFGFARTKSNNSPMFSRRRDPEFSSIPSEIAFRICAIRETFEESGVLIARSTKSLHVVESPWSILRANKEHCAVYHSEKDTTKLVEWRQRVTADPMQFLGLCSDLGIVPDVWSLYDWSNWLTPPVPGNIKKKWTRFDTAFYLCCLKDLPCVAEDASETVHHKWVTPNEILQDCQQGKADFAPPQVYEMSRLCNFTSTHQMLHFINERTGQPMEQMMPVLVNCADAKLYILPGDTLYPSQPDYTDGSKIPVFSQTLEELTKISSRKHRCIVVPLSKTPEAPQRVLLKLECNITPPHNHVKPVVMDVQPN